jgi:hypothetical protein
MKTRTGSTTAVSAVTIPASSNLREAIRIGRRRKPPSTDSIVQGPAELLCSKATQDKVVSAESMRSCSAETIESPVTTW